MTECDECDNGELRRICELCENNEIKQSIEKLIEQRNTAWAELREIRDTISADREEATADEVRRVIVQHDIVQARLRERVEDLRADLRQARHDCVLGLPKLAIEDIDEALFATEPSDDTDTG